MRDFVICGIQQVGIGVKNVETAWAWYRKSFGMDCPIFEETAEAKLMLPYTGGEPRSRHAVLAFNLQSGGGFEIWQYTSRQPVEVSEEINAGNLGIFACKIKVKSIAKTLAHFAKENITILGEPAPDPSGKLTIFLKDPFGNIFQMVEAEEWFMNEKKPTGGAYGVIIGVTDIEKARILYSDILGYDKVVYDTTEVFNDLKPLPGGERKLRRVLLRRSEPFSGPFSKLMGKVKLNFSLPAKRMREKFMMAGSGVTPDLFTSAMISVKWIILKTFALKKDFLLQWIARRVMRGTVLIWARQQAIFHILKTPMVHL
jgi:catechol 2,3-dioxygenase-like lactoylglutathione lyase family enzyme